MAKAVNDKIDIEQPTVAGILNSYWIVVPTYQRDYSWERKEVKAYLDDITLAIESDDSHYFLGTIVTIRRGDDILEVVDGQQRLATTSLVLAAMRSIVGDANEHFKTLISSFIEKISSETLQPELRMQLNFGDNPIFKSLIETGEVGGAYKPARLSHQNLKDAYGTAYDHFSQLTKALSDESKVKWFQNWFKYLHFNTKTILMIVSDDSIAFRMFETLNDRGLEVSRADLIKNYIFGKAGSSIDEAQGHWSALREAIEATDDRDSMVNFIWHSLIATTGPIEQKNIYTRVKSVVTGKQSAIATLSNWTTLAYTYVALTNPESAQWDGYPVKIQTAIKALNLLNILQFRPLLLAIAKQFSKNEAATSFDRIVAMGVRLLIASRTTTQSVWQPLGEAAHKIWKKEIVDAKGMVAYLQKSIPSDEEFKTAFETHTSSKAALARYYLRALHAAEADLGDPSLIATDDPDKLNLEHILPSNPLKNWPQFSAEEVQIYCKRLGNLALLQTKLNSDAKSDSFDKKKPLFAKSKIPTTAMVAAEPAWDPTAIKKRQKYMAELAVKAWPFK